MKQQRKYTSQFKVGLVMQYLKGSKTQADICRENNLNPNLLNKWLKQFEEQAMTIFEPNKVKEFQKRSERLEQIIGKQAIEIDFLKRGLFATYP